MLQLCWQSGSFNHKVEYIMTKEVPMVAGNKQDIEQVAKSLKDNRFETVIISEKEGMVESFVSYLFPGRFMAGGAYRIAPG